MFEKQLLTLVFVRKQTEVLLGLKKRGFGKEKWNGFGGKVEPSETIEQAAKREIKEESHLEVDRLEKVGLLTFEFVGDPVLMEVHVFSTWFFKGQPHETAEMKPQWYPINSIPFDKMWADDKLWFPLLLGDKKFQGYFKFQGHETILDYKLKEVSSLESNV
ncbi:oxidized purine nucleoside triphosphate hydrolase-like [Tachypleus tridentatus]|uniref:oxidized purine nucleoside triphosphate hydrolase-like n=1 Tax=Tachypleus tridentatus TaxID=6853 RepID=UPI003FD214C5